MAQPIAVQLYTLREALTDNFEGVVSQLAEIGYVGVEPFGYPNRDAQAEGRIIQKYNLEVPSIHAQFPAGDVTNAVIEAAQAVGTKRIIAGIGRGDKWDTLDKIKANCDLINEAASNAAGHGLTVGYHNHWWEFDTVVDGRPAYQHMVDLFDPNVFFQIDTYWVQVGGVNVVDVLKQLDSRIPVIHVKDGPADNFEADMVAVGKGVMDWKNILANTSAEWYIVELDRCATDMMTAVAESYAYLVGEGFARGKN